MMVGLGTVTEDLHLVTRRLAPELGQLGLRAISPAMVRVEAVSGPFMAFDNS